MRQSYVGFLFSTLHPEAVPDSLLRNAAESCTAFGLMYDDGGSLLRDYTDRNRSVAAAFPGFVADAIQGYEDVHSDDAFSSVYEVILQKLPQGAGIAYHQFIAEETAMLWRQFKAYAWDGSKPEAANTVQLKLLYGFVTDYTIRASTELRNLSQLPCGVPSAVHGETDRFELACFVFHCLQQHLFTLLFALQNYLTLRFREGKPDWMKPVPELYQQLTGRPFRKDILFKDKNAVCTFSGCTHEYVLLSEIVAPFFTPTAKPSQKQDYFRKMKIPVIARSRETIYVRQCDLRRLEQNLLLLRQ
ncbi:hypothetical protein [Cyclonatronum proteinivorum]|nr:hypothetical protein [Cyclonatronum proteinivorum]